MGIRAKKRIRKKTGDQKELEMEREKREIIDRQIDR